LGVVYAAGLTQILQTNDRPTKLARALKELGRLVKSLCLLRFIDDESCQHLRHRDAGDVSSAQGGGNVFLRRPQHVASVVRPPDNGLAKMPSPSDDLESSPWLTSG